MVPVTPPGVNWGKREAPGTDQRSRQKQKQDPSGRRVASFGQWNERKNPGPFMYIDLSGTAFPLGFGNTFLAEHGFKLAQAPEAKIQKQYYEISKSSKHDGLHVCQIRSSKMATELVIPALKARMTGEPLARVLPSGGRCTVLVPMCPRLTPAA